MLSILQAEWNRTNTGKQDSTRQVFESQHNICLMFGCQYIVHLKQPEIHCNTWYNSV